jgi:circadian clock protein KaiC
MGPAKSPTGIAGLDEITGGGLPTGRPTLVAGAAGAGKTLFGVEFLVRGARDFGEPGVLMSFEESADDIAINVASLGFDLPQLERDGLVTVDAVHLDPSEIVVTGEFDLEGLFIRLGAAVDAIGAKRVVLDTVEVLFGALQDDAIVRAELGRLFTWLRQRGLTAVITGERGPEAGRLTRFGIEEYVSDCVIVLDHRVADEISTRRLRVVKYRGSVHGTNEYPFLITEDGLMVVPITSLQLDYDAPDERVDTGVPGLDEMLGGGVYRGSAVMITGTAGTGKTTLAAQFAATACAAGERVLFLSMEESPSQLERNLRSVGIDLARHRAEGLLHIESIRPTAFGFEEHLAMVHRLVDAERPALVVLDAVASLNHMGQPRETATAIARDIDLLKSRGITTVLTTLMHDSTDETSGIAISSLIDTWLLLRNHEANGERNRLLFVIKSRGSAHSNQVREYAISDQGARLVDVYLGPDGVLTGTARREAISREEAGALARSAEADRMLRKMEARTAELRAQIVALEAKLAAEQADFDAEAESLAMEQAAKQGARLGGAERRSGDAQPGGGHS